MISKELLHSFITEASDLLDDVEPSLVEYSGVSTVDERTEIVNRVFRHFHSIKGSAGFVGLHDTAKLTHEAEALLEQFRRAPQKVISQDNIVLLCRTVDTLRDIFDECGEQGEEGAVPIDGLIEDISQATNAVRKGKTRQITTVRSKSDKPDKPDNTDAGGPDATQIVDPAALNKMVQSEVPQPERKNKGATGDRPTKSRGGPNESKRRTRSLTRSMSPRRDTLVRSKQHTSDTARIIHPEEMTEARMTASEFSGRYVSEANELLEQIEQSLLMAEQNPEIAEEPVQEALRCLHSFKGNSGFMNLVDLERLSHRMESEVEYTIGRSTGLDSQTFDALLQMIDVLRQGVQDYACGGTGAIPEVDVYIGMLDEFTSTRTADSTAPPGPSSQSSSESYDISLAAKPPQSAENAQSGSSRQPEAEPVANVEPTPDREEALAEPPRSGGTTRIELRGASSQQVDLRSMPKADSISITGSGQKPESETADTVVAPHPNLAPGSTGYSVPSAATGENTPETAGPRPERSPVQARNERKGTEPMVVPTHRAPDTAHKRRVQDITARNDIRVDLRKLDAMLDLVGELVIAEAMVTRHPVVWNAENESLERAVHQLRRVASSLQDMATSVRMIPLAPTFRRMTRLVYDLSVKAGKQVDLVLLGEDTEVDRTVIERISDPLVHIIRNAIDHGIETPEDRIEAGKPETGRLTIEGHHEGGEVWIVVTDDGRGLDRQAIIERAISRGILSGDGTDLTDAQVYHYIFEPGFSTAKKVTDISGRGFGMDVVRKNIEKLSGKIDIRSRPGEGTAVVLRIPLTLAIIEGMLINSGGTRYIIPLLSIRESLKPELSQIMSTPDGQELVKLRDELIPIVRLDDTFNRVGTAKSLIDGILMIVEGEDGDVVALFADELLGQQETVIKGLSGWLKKSRGVSGCTILGDGEVGLILDIGAIVKLARQRSPA